MACFILLVIAAFMPQSSGCCWDSCCRDATLLVMTCLQDNRQVEAVMTRNSTYFLERPSTFEGCKYVQIIVCQVGRINTKGMLAPIKYAHNKILNITVRLTSLQLPSAAQQCDDPTISCRKYSCFNSHTNITHIILISWNLTKKNSSIMKNHLGDKSDPALTHESPAGFHDSVTLTQAIFSPCL